MHWLTIITALFYTSILAFLVLVRGWELTAAAELVMGLAFAVILLIATAIVLMHRGDQKAFWQGFRSAIKGDLKCLVDQMRFK